MAGTALLAGRMDTTGFGKATNDLGVTVGIHADNPSHVTIVPHVFTFGSIVNQFSETYQFTFDEALRKGISEASAMRNDGGLIGLLDQRYYPVACSKFEIKSSGPDASDEINEFYKSLIEQTPLWHTFRWQVMEATWFGRYGIQFATGRQTTDGREFEVDGQAAEGISQWIIHQGDKITFTWDFKPCIRVSPFYAPRWRARGATVLEWDDDRLAHDSIHTVWSERGPVVVIDRPELREEFAFPIWRIADAPWDQPDMAGAIRGIGLRNYVFWLWWMRNKMVGWAMNYLQDFGAGGYTVVGFDAGDPNAKAKAQQAFANPEQRIIFVPMTPGEEKVTEMVTRLPSGGTGNDALQNWATNYYGEQIALLITGQPGSSKQANNGLGSNRHEFDQETKQILHGYDKSMVDTCMAHDILRVLKKRNHPDKKFTLSFNSILREASPEVVIDRAKKIFDMGGDISKRWLYATADMPVPEEAEDTLSKEQMDRLQQSIQMGAQPGKPGDMTLQGGHADVMAGHDEASLGEAREALTAKGIPAENQLKHLAGLVESGQLEEHDTPEGLMYTPLGADPLGIGEDDGSQGDNGDAGKAELRKPQPSKSGKKGKEKKEASRSAGPVQFTLPRSGINYAADRDDPASHWAEDIGPRSGKPRWINNETGRIVYEQPYQDGVERKGEEEESPKGGGEGEFNIGLGRVKYGDGNDGPVPDHRAGMAKYKAYKAQRDGGSAKATVERFHSLVDRDGQGISGEGLTTEVAHLDKSLDSAQVLQLAGEYGLKVTPTTSKTAGLAHLDGVLRGTIKQGEGNGKDKQGAGGRVKSVLPEAKGTAAKEGVPGNGSEAKPADNGNDSGAKEGDSGTTQAGRGKGEQSGKERVPASGKGTDDSQAKESVDAQGVPSGRLGGRMKEQAKEATGSLGTPAESTRAVGEKAEGAPGDAASLKSKEGPAVGESAPAGIDELHVDPERFQYKLGTDTKTGVGKSLSKFNKAYAGSILTWVDPADKKEYVINGHHRYDRAKKDGETSINRIRIEAKDAAEARAIGAMANIADEKGTATDIAKLMKDQPDISVDKLTASGVAKDSKLMTEGVELSKLEPGLFRKLTLGTMDERRGLAIAKGAGDDHAAQKTAYGLIEKAEEAGKTITGEQAMYIAQDVALAGKTKGDEGGGLFGDMEDEKSLHVERATLKASVGSELGKIKNAFGAVSSKARADLLGSEGNKIEAEKNKAKAGEAGGMQEIFRQAVKVKGPLNDYLNSQAEKLAQAKGKEVAAVKAETVEGARKILQERLTSNTMSGSSDRVEGGSDLSPASSSGSDDSATSGRDAGDSSFPQAAGFMQPEQPSKYSADSMADLAGQSFTNDKGLSVDVRKAEDGTWTVGTESGLTAQGAANLLNKHKAEPAASLFGAEVTAQKETEKPKEKLEWEERKKRGENPDLPGIKDAFAPGMFGK